MRRRKKAQIGSYAEARKKRESQTAYLMLCPALAGFLIFTGVPILALFISPDFLRAEKYQTFFQRPYLAKSLL